MEGKALPGVEVLRRLALRAVLSLEPWRAQHSSLRPPTGVSSRRSRRRSSPRGHFPHGRRRFEIIGVGAGDAGRSRMETGAARLVIVLLDKGRLGTVSR